MIFSIFVSCPKGLEYLLEDELKAMGFSVSRVSPQGVYGDADLAMIYKICLWSRIAGRVQVILFTGKADNEKALYQLCRTYAWDTIFPLDKTFSIQFHGSSDIFRHTLFGSQVIKDAIVDVFREKTGERPIVSRERPDILLHAHLKKDQMTLSLDMTGYSLHQRGYRLNAGDAPLKEHVAAALLTRAKIKQQKALQDPCCGSGTLVIEAAMMAAEIAPGLLREDQAFQHWLGHDEFLWQQARKEAKAQAKTPSMKFLGSDQDPSLIHYAKENAARAGVSDDIQWEVKDLSEVRPIAEEGLVVMNPPYGERLGEEDALIPLYQSIGRCLHTYFKGWSATILTSKPVLAKALGLRSHKQYSLYNGSLLCKLYCFDLNQNNTLGRTAVPISEGAQMFMNRLKKNSEHLEKWAKREFITCYRLYDADLPEYAFAIDRYGDHIVLQEYRAPNSIDPAIAAKRKKEVIAAIPVVLNIPHQNLVVKERKQQKGSSQYEKLNAVWSRMIVTEGQAKFYLNLHDYLDTGLFLDHRPLRLSFANLPKGTRFLNCFCYTATASIHAAIAGAVTTNVDLSNTYLKWAEDNFKLNGLESSRHQFVQADCIEWLKSSKDKFDVIFLDPPSFSNSKRMKDVLDIQRDHVMLINLARRLLNEGGILYFSTNLRYFKLDPDLVNDENIHNITSKTIDLDFKRNQRIHHCFEINK